MKYLSSPSEDEGSSQESIAPWIIRVGVEIASVSERRDWRTSHLISSVALSTRELRGESPPRDRSRSWTVFAVDEAEWAALRTRLRDDYEGLLVAIKTHVLWDEDALGVVMGAIAHSAYHLGAIRQRLQV